MVLYTSYFHSVTLLSLPNLFQSGFQQHYTAHTTFAKVTNDLLLLLPVKKALLFSFT